MSRINRDQEFEVARGTGALNSFRCILEPFSDGTSTNGLQHPTGKMRSMSNDWKVFLRTSTTCLVIRFRRCGAETKYKRPTEKRRMFSRPIITSRMGLPIIVSESCFQATPRNENNAFAAFVSSGILTRSPGCTRGRWGLLEWPDSPPAAHACSFAPVTRTRMDESGFSGGMTKDGGTGRKATEQ